MNILIAVPTFENILPDTFKSIYGLQIPEGCITQFDFIRGYDCAKARCAIAQEALEYNFDYVLMVDSDIILPRNTLCSMLSRDVDICLGFYPRKNTRIGQTEVFKLGQHDFIDTYYYSELPENICFEVKGGGLGCALIRTDIFGTLAYPYFRYVVYNAENCLSEDNYFCSKATLAGYKVYADTAVKCGHALRNFQWE